jgi:hypothetical protein
MQIESDARGIVRVVDDQGTVWFDKNQGVNRAGWSALRGVQTKHKNVTESTGAATTKNSITD